MDVVQPPNSHRWIVTPKPRHHAAARLFCFPYAGVGSSAYRGWADAAPTHIEVCLIQPPGRENRLREAPLASIGSIVGKLIAELVPLGATTPFAFFGHSMGAVVAFETIRQLRRIGAPLPAALFVAASRAPQLAWPHPPVRHLDDVALLEVLNRRYGSVPRVVVDDPELRALLTPALRSDMAAVETYAYETEAPLDLPVFAFGGDEDRMVGRQELQHWNAQTTSSFRLRMMPGTHLFTQERRDDLIADISAALSIATAHRRTSRVG
jgi:surfactin synthase thioesterase subunit